MRAAVRPQLAATRGRRAVGASAAGGPSATGPPACAPADAVHHGVPEPAARRHGRRRGGGRAPRRRGGRGARPRPRRAGARLAARGAAWRGGAAARRRAARAGPRARVRPRGAGAADVLGSPPSDPAAGRLPGERLRLPNRPSRSTAIADRVLGATGFRGLRRSRPFNWPRCTGLRAARGGGRLAARGRAPLLRAQLLDAPRHPPPRTAVKASRPRSTAPSPCLGSKLNPS